MVLCSVHHVTPSEASLHHGCACLASVPEQFASSSSFSVCTWPHIGTGGEHCTACSNAVHNGADMPTRCPVDRFLKLAALVPPQLALGSRDPPLTRLQIPYQIKNFGDVNSETLGQKTSDMGQGSLTVNEGNALTLYRRGSPLNRRRLTVAVGGLPHAKCLIVPLRV